MLRRLLASCMILFVLTSSLGQGIFAEEMNPIHSLDTLPYGDTGEGDREKLLETLESLESDMKAEKYTLSASLELPDETIALLSDKRSFDLSPSIFSGFVLDPFQGFFSSSLVSGSGIFSLVPTLSDEISSEILFSDTSLTRTLRVERNIKNRKKVSSTKGYLTVNLFTGTMISTLSGELIDPAKIGFSPLGSLEKSKAKAKYEKKMKNRGTKKKGLAEAAVEGFEFGLSGTHLIFSSPVELSIDTPNMGEGMALDIMTMHAGDADFHTGGLSVSPDTLCNTDGSASIPGSQASVKNGKVTFYTCGASSFTMNPTGGTAGSNDLRLVIGDCAQTQIYYNGLAQVYTGNPPATGCSTNSTMDSWPVLRIGGTSYGNDFTAWTTNTTTGSTNGNTYTATSTMTRVVGGLTYTLIIDWSHTAPNKYVTWSWRVIIPAGNTNNVIFYYGMDTFVAGGDTNDTGYYTLTGGQTLGVYDSVANVLSAFRYMSGVTWTAHQADRWNNVRAQIAGGANFTNFVDNAGGDLGFGINWNFGTGANVTYSGTVEWRLLPYVSTPTVDLIPGIAQPEGPLAVGALSQLPITIDNIGNLSSSGVHTVVFTVPTNITGPASPFTDNGWSCGAQVGTGVTCTKTTNISAPSGTDNLRIPVTPTLAASGTSVTFTVRVSNPGDGNVSNNTAFATNSVVGGAPVVDAGGIAGESFWLQANNSRTNCTIQGCTITGWTNIGGLGAAANAVAGLGTVTYDANTTINGNPTVYFNNASLNTNSNLNITTAAASVFAVTRIGTGGAWRLGPQTAVNNSLDWMTTSIQDRFALYNGVVFYSGANLRSPNVPAITSSLRQAGGASAQFTNARQTLASATPATAFVTASIGPGRSNTTNATLTNLAEIITFPIALTLAQKNQVESYLAIKYGITLDQTTPTNYTVSGGVIVWNATLAGAFNNNIAGIGRDDVSTLNQNRSQSVTNTGDIIVSKSAIATNRIALTWAHDNTQITTFTPTDAPTGYQRMTREWLFQEKNGDLGTVNISYPASSIGTGFTAPLILLADTDSTFSSGATAYTGTYSTGTNTWDFSLNIADMQYVIFAKTVSIDTTPPTILSNSVASGTLAPIGTFPITITYSDTGSAINTGSLTGAIYAWDSTGATWSPTDIAGAYLSIVSASTSTGVFQLTGLPFGKYRFDLSIRDTVGNTQTQSYTYYIDGLTWTISAPTYSIGPAQTSIQTFGTGELLLTVQTVGAGFDLTMLRTTDLTYITDVIPVYSGSTGWGYDKNTGSGYSSTITAHGTTQTIVSVAKAINTNGQRNTFVYRVKFGVNASANTPAGDYSGNVRFGINLTY